MNNEDKPKDIPVTQTLLFGAPLYKATPAEEKRFREQMDKANAEYEKRRERMPSTSQKRAENK